MTFDLDIWHGGSSWPCLGHLRRSKVKVVSQLYGVRRKCYCFFRLWNMNARCEVSYFMDAHQGEFFVLEWSVRPRLRPFYLVGLSVVSLMGVSTLRLPSPSTSSV